MTYWYYRNRIEPPEHENGLSIEEKYELQSDQDDYEYHCWKDKLLEENNAEAEMSNLRKH